jgi:Flp pilus assembly protein TadB
MNPRIQPEKLRYTLAGITLSALAWLGLFVLIGLGFIMIGFAAPFAGIYAFAVVGYTGVVSEAHEFARRRARTRPTKEPLPTRRLALTVRRAAP